MDPSAYLKLWKFFRFDFENLMTKFLAGRSWSRDAFEVLMDELHVYAYFHSSAILTTDQTASTVDPTEAQEVTIKLLLKTAKEVWLQPYFIAPELKAKYDEREAERKAKAEKEKNPKVTKEEEEVIIPDNWLEMKRRIAGLYLTFLLYQHQPRLWEDYLPIEIDLSDLKVINKFAADLKVFDIRMDDLAELKNEVKVTLGFLRVQAFRVVASTEEYGSELTVQYDDAREAEAKFNDIPKAWKEDFVFNSKLGRFVVNSKTNLKGIVSDFNKAVLIAKNMAQYNHEMSSQAYGSKAGNSEALPHKTKTENEASVSRPRPDSSLDFLDTYMTSASSNKNVGKTPAPSEQNSEASMDFLDSLLEKSAAAGSDTSQMPTNSQTTSKNAVQSESVDEQQDYSYSSLLGSLDDLMTPGEATTTTTDYPESMDTMDGQVSQAGQSKTSSSTNVRASENLHNQIASSSKASVFTTWNTTETKKKKRKRGKKTTPKVNDDSGNAGTPATSSKTPFNWDTMTLKEKTAFALKFQSTITKASVLQGQMENLHELMLKLVITPKEGGLKADLAGETPKTESSAAGTASENQKKGKKRKPRASRAQKPPQVLKLHKDEESMNVVLDSFGFDKSQIKIPETKVKTPEIPQPGIEKYLELRHKVGHKGVNTDPQPDTGIN